MGSQGATLAALALLACTFLLAPVAEACNGFKLRVKSFDTKCADGSESIFSVKDFGVTLTPDCKFIPRGCAVVSKNFETAEVMYKVKTSTGMPLAEGTKNGCEAMDEAAANAAVSPFLDMFQLPKSCPVEASEKCADGKVVDVAPFKDKLMPGSVKVEVVIKHDKGMMSCINFEGALRK